MSTPPNHDAVRGIILVALIFAVAVTSGAWIIAVVSGLILVAVGLALMPG